MSTYVYMRILESAPYRYDSGMRILSLGRIAALYEEVAELIVHDGHAPRVLEIGCGTGNLTRALLARGATVTAIDVNPDMLAIAAAKLRTAHGQLDLREMTAVEIADRFLPESFDAVAASLVFSEMSEAEQAYVLAAARRVLRTGGQLAIADEMRASTLLGRIARVLVRWPIAAVTYVLTQTSTAAVRDLTGRVRAAGFRVLDERHSHGSSIVVAERP
jgi:ubiquinone/menaquinone biosynthesis C-methylase UbiE